MTPTERPANLSHQDMTTDLMVTGGTTPIVLVKPHDVDPSCHLRNTGGWSQSTTCVAPLAATTGIAPS
ncbi:BZ3500_MvSof-1268-A1-R1_Chr1-2g01495 [Microbotryum saponariae]|uniref:BZ3500_MvSof-1268-A1-R1_Chr1-2g01495 protein n=1 Tax=Microbotryum saponariae TaxID=289078 RepID=A0A2X0KEU0_9BASI|nr:BZ3500_MvSof-1268-A1-R1_Chr1-2g01495 [Microbotryum saponariae]SCZ97503.1 BZ3501_MvSof-1269-A2-R1_Chr1-2g01094 [Microbotryum saponariae]